jgi:TrmH family RNA methyltransferase
MSRPTSTVPSRGELTSLSNPRVKQAVKLRQRSHRDELGLTLVEGYREVTCAVDNSHPLETVFFCPEFFLGSNEAGLLQRCRANGAALWQCTKPVFAKLSYRDRPDGLLAVAPQVRAALEDTDVPADPLLVVAQSIEKPGNLGTILRSADAAGVQAVIVCDRCTDINNPNVVRASVGTLFSVPVVETTTELAQNWLRQRGIRTVAATPHASTLYTDTDLTGGIALSVGAEQYGLTGPWLEAADLRVRIPMLGRADSLNVASATTILLYEALRQRTGRSA